MTKSYFIRYRYLGVMLAHLVMIVAAYLASFYLRLDFNLPEEYLILILKTLPLLIVIKILVFHYFDLFSGLWQYVSMDDLWRILKANILSTLIFIFGVFLVYRPLGYPRSVFILDFILCTSFIDGARFLSRLFRKKHQPPEQKRKKRTLIVGAGEAGILILKECQNMNLEVVGFIDDDSAKKDTRIYGIKVLGGREIIKEIVPKFNVEQIIIAIPSAKGEVIRQIISYCDVAHIEIKIIPGLYKILSGELEVKYREVQPEDLLGRETVLIDEGEINSYLEDKRILITGGGGSIGSELCRQVVSYKPSQIILCDHNENDTYFLEVELKAKFPDLKLQVIIADITEKETLKYIFSQYHPQVVIHSAAYKHVPLMEENPIAAIKNNVLGTRDIIYISEEYQVEKFVFISSDKAVNPTSVMGASKRIAEIVLQAKAKKSRTKFMAVRFGNVIGSSGSVVPLFKKQIANGGPITITDPEATRYFMSVKEAVQLVLQAGAIGEGGEIFILDMGESIKILDLARNLVALSGLELEKDIPVRYIGLRPGEKLFEEPFLKRGNLTKHKKIYIAQPDDFDLIKLETCLQDLERLVNLMDKDKIIQEIKRILPSYSPGTLDKG